MKIGGSWKVARYVDDGEGNHIDRIRKQPVGYQKGLGSDLGTLFCETCQKRKPKNGEKAYKGWKCQDCRGVKK